jgi:PAS domain S-box-containing protein
MQPSADGLEEEQVLLLEAGLWDHAIIGLDPGGQIARWSRGAGRVFGYSDAEIVGQPYARLFRPDGIASVGVDHEWERAKAEGRAEWERWNVRKDGSSFWAGGIVVAMRDAAGGLRSYSVLIRDLTERRQIEEALRDRVRRSDWIADIGNALGRGTSLRDGLLGCAGLMVRHLDAALAQVWTYNDVEEMLELQAGVGIDAHPDEGQDRLPVGKSLAGQIARDRQSLLTNAVLGDPRVHDQEWAIREGLVAFAGHPLITDGRLVGVMALYGRRPLADATLEALAAVADAVARGIERRRSEEEQARLLILERQARIKAEAAEKRYRNLVEGLDAIVWEADPGTHGFTFVSRRAEPLLGYPVARWLAQPDFLETLIHRDDRGRALALRRDALAAGLDYDLEYRVTTADQRIVRFRELGHVDRDEQGRPLRFCGLLVDAARATAGDVGDRPNIDVA